MTRNGIEASGRDVKQARSRSDESPVGEADAPQIQGGISNPPTSFPEAVEQATIIRDEMINVARRLADRDYGAMQSEIREAQIEYLAEAITSLTSPAVVEDPHSDEVERMREMIVELWHDAKGEHGDLHQCLGMTWKQYQDWVVPANKEGGE